MNHAPTLEGIDDISASLQESIITVPVTAADLDGDTLTLDAEVLTTDPVAQVAADLNDAHNFGPGRSEGYNYRGQNEKYFFGDGAQWFYILPEGAVHRFNGNLSTSPFVGQLDASYHADLNSIYTAEEPNLTPPNISLTWSGTDLLITRNDSSAQPFDIQVTATDGRAEATTSFYVDIVNHAPTIAEIDDVVASHLQDVITVSVDIADADGDAYTRDAARLHSRLGERACCRFERPASIPCRSYRSVQLPWVE